jgi:hypothetical protein
MQWPTAKVPPPPTHTPKKYPKQNKTNKVQKKQAPKKTPQRWLSNYYKEN